MRDFLLVFKVLFRNQNARRVAGNGRLGLSQNLKAILCMLPLALLICVAGGFIAVMIPDLQSFALVGNVIVSAVQVFVLFVTMFTVMNTLYNSPDTPFLNTLPIRPAAVFFAKFAIVYLNALALMASILVPTLLTVSIVYSALGKTMFYGFFALIALIAVVSPILPLFIVTIFSMPISYIGTFFKGRAVLKTVMSLAFYLLIMVGYMLLIYFLGENTGSDENVDFAISQNAFAGLAVFSKVMYPNKVLIDFCLGISAGKNFGIWLAITVGMIAVMLVLALLFYKRINEKRLETHTETAKGNSSFKQSNVIVALMKKDFMQIIRNPHLAMSSLANIILCPVLTAIMYFTGNMQSAPEPGNEFLDYMLKLAYLIMYTIIFLGGANTMSMLAYTREGKSFYLGKSLPIKARDSIKAKYFLALIPTAIVLLIQVVIAFALYKLDVLSVVLFILCVALTVAGATGLHIYCDMRFGNVNWNTRQDMQQVSKANKGSYVVVFWVIFIGLLAMGGGIALSQFESLIGGKTVVLAVFWSILFVLSAATMVAGILVLKFKAEPFYNEIGEREYKPRSGFQRKRNGGFGGNNMLIK